MDFLLLATRRIWTGSVHASRESFERTFPRNWFGAIWCHCWRDSDESSTEARNSRDATNSHVESWWWSTILNGHDATFRNVSIVDDDSQCSSYVALCISFLWLANGVLSQVLFRLLQATEKHLMLRLWSKSVRRRWRQLLFVPFRRSRRDFTPQTRRYCSRLVQEPRVWVTLLHLVGPQEEANRCVGARQSLVSRCLHRSHRRRFRFPCAWISTRFSSSSGYGNRCREASRSTSRGKFIRSRLQHLHRLHTNIDWSQSWRRRLDSNRRKASRKVSRSTCLCIRDASGSSFARCCACNRVFCLHCRCWWWFCDEAVCGVGRKHTNQCHWDIEGLQITKGTAIFSPHHHRHVIEPLFHIYSIA